MSVFHYTAPEYRVDGIRSSAKWGIPVLSLSSYLKFWTVVCYAVTLWLIFVKKEDKASPDDDDMDLVKVYKIIWHICKLPRKIVLGVNWHYLTHGIKQMFSPS